MTSSFLTFLNHTQRRNTVCRTPLDEWSSCCRDLYLTKPNTHNRQTSMTSAGFEPTISTGERPQTYALDRQYCPIFWQNSWNFLSRNIHCCSLKNPAVIYCTAPAQISPKYCPLFHLNPVKIDYTSRLMSLKFNLRFGLLDHVFYAFLITSFCVICSSHLTASL